MQLIDQHTKRIMEGCKERAREAGLRFEDETLEYIVTNRDLLELSPKMMIPTLYDYWVHDVEVLKEKGRYELYPGNPYETVINTRPAISFYNDNNPDWLNVMIFYHVLAHIDFFQNNIFFRHTWDYDFDRPGPVRQAPDRQAALGKGPLGRLHHRIRPRHRQPGWIFRCDDAARPPFGDGPEQAPRFLFRRFPPVDQKGQDERIHDGDRALQRLPAPVRKPGGTEFLFRRGGKIPRIRGGLYQKPPETGEPPAGPAGIPDGAARIF